jgi:hypothetical protein
MRISTILLAARNILHLPCANTVLMNKIMREKKVVVPTRIHTI